MRKLLLSAALAISLAGCGVFKNPINTNDLAAIESAYDITLAAAVAYRKLPLCLTGTTESITNVCARRSVIVKLQQADQTARAAIIAAEQFTFNNPTLNASSIIVAAQSAVAAFQSLAITNNVVK